MQIKVITLCTAWTSIISFLIPSNNFHLQHNNNIMSFKPASGRKRESDVWKYFTYDAVADKSVCTSCEQKITGKNSTNLKRHLEYRHDDLFKLVSR